MHYLKNCKTAYDYQSLQFPTTQLLDIVTKGRNEYYFQLSRSLYNPATKCEDILECLKIFL